MSNTALPQKLPTALAAPSLSVEARVVRLGKRIRKNLIAYVFLAPAFILMAVFLAYPLVESMLLSLYQWNGISPREYVGLRNFQDLLEDEVFFLALRNNVIFSVFTTLGTVVLGFLLALAIERRVKGWRYFKVVYFLPVMMSTTIVGLLWGRLLDPTFGPINSLLRAVGWADPPMWLAEPGWAMAAIIIVSIWQYAGFPMIIYLAAIEGIPQEIHEAATLDGVNWWQRALMIILPMVKNVTFTIVILQLIFSFKVFDIVYTMTLGGPGEATNVLGIYLYRTAFKFTQFGYGSAIAVMMFIIVFILSIFYLRQFRTERVEY
jgi:ABC-type sugar transport system permease subunit